jgi:hypothetical protein
MLRQQEFQNSTQRMDEKAIVTESQAAEAIIVRTVAQRAG